MAGLATQRDEITKQLSELSGVINALAVADRAELLEFAQSTAEDDAPGVSR